MALLKTAFVHNFATPVWRLLFEQVPGAPGLLLAELRDGSKRSLQVSTLQLPNGELLTHSLELPWSAAVLGIWNGYALYHRLDNERLPVPTALGCLDVRRGEIRWEWPGHMLSASDGQLVEATRTSLAAGEMRQPVWFSLLEGQPVDGVKSILPAPNPSLQFPTHYPETSQYWPLLNRFVEKYTNHLAIQAIDYLEVADKIIFSYYVYGNTGKKQSYLLITDRQQTVWLHQPLLEQTASDKDSERSDGLAGAFCVWQNQILALAQPTQLVSYFLT
ncbi:hypothetical protein [Tellurirhabdus bombi]|uniref:hypothetical protein n=1 Tax=Tellurirhabdus bombi TaxID=2907205 RepID=UPI001F1FC6EE|nr:hypothetical protein [Tellurirhabdus bombi]